MENIMENQKTIRKVNFWFRMTMISEFVAIAMGFVDMLIASMCVFATFGFSILFIIFFIRGLNKKATEFIKIGMIIHGAAIVALILLGFVFIFEIPELSINKLTWIIEIIIYCISFALYIKAYMCSKQNDYLKTQEGYPEFNQLCMELKNKHFVEPKYEFDYSGDGSMEELVPPEIND